MNIKHMLAVAILVIFTALVHAQCPQACNYQTKVLDAGGMPMINRTIQMRFFISDSINPGTPVYREKQILTTNQFGFTTCWIGQGTSDIGSFPAINWASTNKYMQVELDRNVIGNFINMGIELLASVPYALYADSARKGGYPTHYIGEYYGGGIVFYVTGNGQHGLIADSADLQTGIWAQIDSTVTNAKLSGTGGGSLNTERIIVNQGAGNYAAQLCANYTGGGYGDWFLPDLNELNLLYNQQQAVGGFNTSSTYWSSTETGATAASAVTFATGVTVAAPKSTANKMRAIRAF